MSARAGRSVGFMIRTLRPRQIVSDVAIALVCGSFELFLAGNGFHFSPLALVGMVVALALRRLSPPLALSIAWVTALVQVLAGIGADASNLAILAVLYATASYGSPLVKWAGLVSSGLGAVVITAYYSAQALIVSSTPSTIPGVALSFVALAIVFVSALAGFALSWTLGLLAKTWRTSRANTQARILAERASIDAQQSVVIEQERNRIARDMHDVVAHSLAVVIAQADGARYLGAKDTPALDAALITIASTAREALGDVRILLGQLRHSQGDAPQPVLADLDRLFNQFRDAGLAVRWEESGTSFAVPTGTQLAVYRIVQEALTNVLRHGASESGARVAFRWTDHEVTIEIESMLREDSAESPVASGHGIAGMFERAALSGGSLVAGPRDGQFSVTATFPVVHLGASA